MQKEEYKELVKKHVPKEKRLKNAITSFLVGGSIALFSEILITFLIRLFDISYKMGSQITCIIVILVASLLTAMGIFDNLVDFAKCGLIIPTTGFAHSISSAVVDYKKEGMITGMGANIFKLAGSVILYSIVFSFLLCVIRVVLWGL